MGHGVRRLVLDVCCLVGNLFKSEIVPKMELRPGGQRLGRIWNLMYPGDIWIALAK